MAAKKTTKYPYQWPDGTWHSIPAAQHKQNVLNATTKLVGGRPYVPPGSYDPNLDAQLRASKRGLTDLIGVGTSPDTYGGDIGKALERGDIDYTRATQQTAEDYASGQQRTEQGYQRNLSDLLTARERGGQDYQSNIGTLQRNYSNLATSQAQAQRKAGVLPGGGAIAQAARKREGNLQIDRAPIDTAYQRAVSDSQLGEQRLGQDRQSTLSDLLTGYNRQTGQLGTTQLRNVEDFGTQATRAQREANAFGQDVQTAKAAQFFQNNTTANRLPIVGQKRVPLTAQELAAQRVAAAKKKKARR
jgi:hypothetical protein